jgi:hypothetical protein
VGSNNKEKTVRYLFMFTAMTVLLAGVAFAEKDDPAPVVPGYVMDSRMDDFGYIVGEECDFTLMDISTSGTLVGDGDDVLMGPIPISGDDPFNFYDTDYTEVWLSSNGFLSFFSGDYNDLSNMCPYPDPGYPNPRIAVLHDDLDLEPGIGTAWYEYFEVCPQQGRDDDEPCTVIMWSQVAHWPGGNGPWWDQEAILFHRTGDMVLLIGAGNPETGSGSTTAIARDGDELYSLTIACDEEGTIPDDSCFWIWHPFPVATENTSFSALKSMYR